MLFCEIPFLQKCIENILSEKSLVHEVFMSMANPEQLSFASKNVPENSVWMENHKLKNLIICHPEVGFYRFH